MVLLLARPKVSRYIKALFNLFLFTIRSRRSWFIHFRQRVLSSICFSRSAEFWGLAQKLYWLNLEFTIFTLNSLNRAVRFTVCVFEVTGGYKRFTTKILTLDHFVTFLCCLEWFCLLFLTQSLVFSLKMSISRHSNLESFWASIWLQNLILRALIKFSLRWVIVHFKMKQILILWLVFKQCVIRWWIR